MSGACDILLEALECFIRKKSVKKNLLKSPKMNFGESGEMSSSLFDELVMCCVAAGAFALG